MFALAAIFLMMGLGSASAQIREWTLVERGLQKRTTLALQRYYTIVQPDTIRLRYLRTNAGMMPYRLRGSRAIGDSVGQLLAISLGQLTLYSPSSLRIAFGEELYAALLGSRSDSGADDHSVFIGDGLWGDPLDDHRIGIALDRVDYRFSRSLGVFAQIGSPESNFPWWEDGTARVGITSPTWEFAALLPFAAGADGVGPYRERLLAPAFGAAIRVTLGSIIARVRFTGVDDASFDAPRNTEDLFVHTLASQASYQLPIGTRLGSFLLSGGIDYEEFAGITRAADGTPQQTRRIRRLSPLADVVWNDQEGNIRASIGVANLALRGSLLLRLTDALAIELRAVDNDLFRTIKPFEHPFLLFFTPQIRL